jgi:hypothetical protein
MDDDDGHKVDDESGTQGRRGTKLPSTKSTAILLALDGLVRDEVLRTTWLYACRDARDHAVDDLGMTTTQRGVTKQWTICHRGREGRRTCHCLQSRGTCHCLRSRGACHCLRSQGRRHVVARDECALCV